MAAASARRTKIIATLGPATASHERIAALVHAGMDCARLNFSHGTHEQHAETLRTLRAVQEEIGRADCAIIEGGRITSHKGVNLPGVPLPIPSLTRKDLKDLEFALAQEVDFVALSFVRSAADVRDLRGLIDQAGSHAAVVAKVEKAEAVEALDAIVVDADALMVARGDLGVEIGPASVPRLQKRIIIRSLDNGKPVITATQMLESMVHQAEPTRAEASDVANAVLDGTSALMLSQETAIGEHPVAAVAYMDRIARAVEPSLGYRHQLPEASEEPTIGRAMSNAACDLAEALWSRSLEAVRANGLVAPGDRVVITAGTLVNVPGTTHVIKVEVA